MVNINDIDSPEMSENKLEAIFSKQRELMGKYHHIERKNGFYVPSRVPVNLHDAQDQHKLKDFAWRVTEELGEALEATDLGHEKAHNWEELADALHFLTEMSILCGYQPQYSLEMLFSKVARSVDEDLNQDPTYLTGLVVKQLARACNCLKNKPWKQTQMLTDTAHFMNCIDATWMCFILLCHCSGINAEIMYDLYFRKSEVNKFRQRSLY